jgi:RecB family exonuclease
MVTKKKEVTREQIDKDLADYLLLCPNPEVDETQVKIDYPLVSATVVNQYLLPANAKSGVLEVEKKVVAKVMDGIYVAGTCDRIEGDCVVDFKTVASKPNELAIPFGYKIQLLAYAFALRRLGYEINRIRLVYGVKPTKKLSARCYVVTEEIDYMAEKLVNDTLRLIGESVIAVRQHPELAYLIFKSMDLKEQ